MPRHEYEKTLQQSALKLAHEEMKHTEIKNWGDVQQLERDPIPQAEFARIIAGDNWNAPLSCAITGSQCSVQSEVFLWKEIK